MTTDLTLVVTAHNETAVCGPTMRSADLAVAAARAAGITVQTIIGLDHATPATTSYFQDPRFDHWDRWELQQGDLGRARNEIVPQTDGELIAFLDADDLFSENWLVEAVGVLRAAAERGERAIAHPELNMVFDGNRSILVNIPDDSPLFTPHYLYVRHCYDSLLMAPREAHLELPYVSRDVPNGLSFQDYQFTIESLGAGWRHLVVPDTIIFKRRRDYSLVTESNTRKSIVRSIPAMAIDRVRGLGFHGRRDETAQ
jgi:hypothetical protein